jgi:3D (Asp-Asp-Asp) domain-containing protein
MFTHGKSASRLWVGCLLAAGMLLLLLVATVLAPSSTAEAADLYVVTEDDYMHIDHATEDVFLTTAASLTTRGTGSDIRLTYGQQVLVLQYGVETLVTAQTETVSDLLRRQNIQRGPLDMVMVDITAEPVKIILDSQLVFYEKDEVVTPSAVTYVENNTLPTWCEQVVQQGQDGVDRKVYEVIYSEGKEVSRQLVEETRTEPTETIIARGTLENFAPNDAEVAEIITNEDGTGTLVLADGHTVTFNQSLTMKATAYTAGEPGVNGITASGTQVRIGTVAIDRRMFSFGTKFYIVSNDGAYTYGFSIAEDVGGAIKNNRIDLYFNTLAECKAFGVRNCTVYVID